MSWPVTPSCRTLPSCCGAQVPAWCRGSWSLWMCQGQPFHGWRTTEGEIFQQRGVWSLSELWAAALDKTKCPLKCVPIQIFCPPQYFPLSLDTFNLPNCTGRHFSPTKIVMRGFTNGSNLFLGVCHILTVQALRIYERRSLALLCLPQFVLCVGKCIFVGYNFTWPDNSRRHTESQILFIIPGSVAISISTGELWSRKMRSHVCTDRLHL